VCRKQNGCLWFDGKCKHPHPDAEGRCFDGKRAIEGCMRHDVQHVMKVRGKHKSR
jgi:hypothetical protein